MRRGVFFNLIFIGAGLLYILIPVIFPVCTSHGGSVMKCHWTARAETGLGAVLIMGGLLYCLAKNEARRLDLSQMIGVLAILGGALPTLLIGVCANEAMLCRAGTLPAWTLLSGFLLAISVLDIRRLSKKISRDPEEGACA